MTRRWQRTCPKRISLGHWSFCMVERPSVILYGSVTARAKCVWDMFFVTGVSSGLIEHLSNVRTVTRTIQMDYVMPARVRFQEQEHLSAPSCPTRLFSMKPMNISRLMTGKWGSKTSLLTMAIIISSSPSKLPTLLFNTSQRIQHSAIQFFPPTSLPIWRIHLRQRNRWKYHNCWKHTRIAGVRRKT